MEDRSLRVAVLGCGVVGTEVVRRLHQAAPDLAHRIGTGIELVGVAVRDLDRPRDAGVGSHLFTDDPFALVKRDDIDIVVELVGGVEPARSLVMEAMAHGAGVVSANKALLAEHGPELHRTAAHSGVELHYEAAVAGAVPLLRLLRESLAGDDVLRVTGIVNGTTNYILDRMSSTGADFDAALREARALGFAEADPSADVQGYDAVAKAAILTALAFHTWPAPGTLHREGITGITPADVAHARSLDCEVKLVAVCERDPRDGSVATRVHPAMVPRHHPLAAVRGADNAVLVESVAAGRLLFQGAGAGGAPTAGAVLGDVVAAARGRLAGTATPPPPLREQVGMRPMSEVRGRHHIAVEAVDGEVPPDEVVAVLRRHAIPVEAVRRQSAPDRDVLLVVTGVATERSVRAAVPDLAALPAVSAAPRVLRML